MKKVIACLIAMVMMVAFSVTAFAAEFVPSIEIKKGPTVVTAVDENGNEYIIILTPLSETEKLKEPAKSHLLDAYDELKKVDDLTALTEALKTIIANKNIDSDNLIVKDLFDLTIDGEFKGNVITITLTDDQLKNFVGLMVKTDKGWELIDDAKIVNGNQLTFSMEGINPTGSLGSFAIIANNGAPSSPNTGLALPMTLIALAVVFAGAAVVFFVKARKTAC